MNNKFEITTIAGSDIRINEELDGIIPKTWVQTRRFGKVLFKEAANERDLIAESRTDWSEKVVSEINQLIKLPTAQYELAVIINNNDRVPGTLSIDLSRPGDEERFPLEQLLEQSIEKYNYAFDYQVENVIKALSDNNIRVPPNLIVPEGINDGADMFVGILMIDATVGNSDRHDRNLDIVRQIDGEFYLSPVFDHGYSLGAIEDDDLRSWIAPKQYNAYHNFSSFTYEGDDISGLEAFKQAAVLRPEAAKIWLDRLDSIETKQIQNIFDRIPNNCITPEAKKFASELLKYNRTQLLNLRSQLTVSKKDLANLYTEYSQNTKLKGLAEAKEIAKNALAAGIKSEQIADMLRENNSAYKELAGNTDLQRAEKLIIKKARIELALQRSNRLSQQQILKSESKRTNSRSM